MDRTRRLSEAIVQRYPEAFGPDFEENKKALDELAFISSKQLKNSIAGYIAKAKKREIEPPEERAEAPVE